MAEESKCIAHDNQIKNIQEDIKMLLIEDTITVKNGAEKEITVKQAITDLWHRNYETQGMISEINERTMVLKDMSDFVASCRRIKRYLPSFKAIVGVLFLGIAIFGGIEFSAILSIIKGLIGL